MTYIIRPILPCDAEAIHEMRTMPGVMETTTAMPSERISHSEGFIARLGENDHQFVAVSKEADGREQVIGWAGIAVYSGRKRHCAGLGIMVHRDWQAQGIGTALLKKVLDVADNWLGLMRTELTVFPDNAHAVRLYERFGFEREGVHRLGILRAGEYCDELTMARLRFPNTLNNKMK